MKRNQIKILLLLVCTTICCARKPLISNRTGVLGGSSWTYVQGDKIDKNETYWLTFKSGLLYQYNRDSVLIYCGGYSTEQTADSLNLLTYVIGDIGVGYFFQKRNDTLYLFPERLYPFKLKLQDSQYNQPTFVKVPAVSDVSSE